MISRAGTSGFSRRASSATLLRSSLRSFSTIGSPSTPLECCSLLGVVTDPSTPRRPRRIGFAEVGFDFGGQGSRRGRSWWWGPGSWVGRWWWSARRSSWPPARRRCGGGRGARHRRRWSRPRASASPTPGPARPPSEPSTDGSSFPRTRSGRRPARTGTPDDGSDVRHLSVGPVEAYCDTQHDQTIRPVPRRQCWSTGRRTARGRHHRCLSRQRHLRRRRHRPRSGDDAGNRRDDGNACTPGGHEATPHHWAVSPGCTCHGRACSVVS